MANSYYPGETLVLSGSRTVDDTPTNGTNVTVTVRDPEGTATTYSGTVVNDGTGEYHVNVQLPETALPGTWWYRFDDDAGTNWSRFDVRRSPLA